MEPLGNKIKTERKARGWSADTLARKIGRDRQQVYAYEADKANPPREVLSALVREGILTADEALGTELGAA